MRNPAGGGLLDHTAAELEASAFAKAYPLDPVDAGEPKPDARFRGLGRKEWRLRLAPELVQLEALFGPDGHAEVVSLWMDRRWLANRAELSAAVDVYAAFVVDMLGALPSADVRPVGDLLAVPYEMIKLFDGLLKRLPSTPRDGAGAFTEVLLGRRLEATQVVRMRGATLLARNDDSGRMCVGIAAQSAALEFGALLFAAPLRFGKREGVGAGVAGFRTQELEATPFGKRFGLDLDRAAPPVGRIARRYFSVGRAGRGARIVLMLEPTRGVAGVLLRLDQEWMEQSDRNFFAGLEVLAGFVAEGAGDSPDAPTRVEIGDFFACSDDDADLLAVLQKELPFVQKGKMGAGTAVFVGEASRGDASLDGGRVGMRMVETEDGWLDCLFYLTELEEHVVSAEQG